eukprot:TRINITY_DN29621_c0_g1_i1.p1 TRINITY_DN29621_c0_g1~~TRINITY_DN29621_c0_g1_i1.p1  ORF type:complete len:400 (+),score=147.18 TRINITY_DN29621_c0_g1_i1:49-1200(+)
MFQMFAMVAVCATAQMQQQPMNKVMLSEYPFAKCLDGTDFAMYWRKAIDGSQHPNEWVFFLQGGGCCIGELACKHRAEGMLGSSLNYSDTSIDVSGTCSQDKTYNPFWDFNHVFLPYCSGDLHTGTETEDNQWGLRFAGHHNVNSTVQWLLKNADLSQATRVLLTGDSAGGIGTFNNADLMQELLPHAAVWAMPNAGWYFPIGTHTFVEWELGIDIPFNFAFAELVAPMYKSYLNPHCTKVTEVKERCIDASVNYPHIQVPLLVLENMYDSQQIVDELLCDPKVCPKAYISAYGTWMRDTMHKLVLNDTRPHNSLWMPSCYQHTGDLCMNSTTPINGKQVNEIAQDWYFNNAQVKIIDGCQSDSPCNPGCDLNECVDLVPPHM